MDLSQGGVINSPYHWRLTVPHGGSRKNASGIVSVVLWWFPTMVYSEDLCCQGQYSEGLYQVVWLYFILHKCHFLQFSL